MDIFSMHLHNILSLTPSSFHSLYDFVSQCLANFALGCNLVSQENAPVLHNLVSRATIVVQLQSDSTPRVMQCKWSVHRSHGHLNAMNSFTRSLYMRENTEYNHSQSEWCWLANNEKCMFTVEDKYGKLLWYTFKEHTVHHLYAIRLNGKKSQVSILTQQQTAVYRFLKCTVQWNWQKSLSQRVKAEISKLRRST